MKASGGTALTAGQWWAIVLCALAAFFDGYDAQMLAMAIPLMADAFQVAPPAFAAAASGSLAGMAIGAMLLSPLADRFGRRPMLIISLALLGSATLYAMRSTGPNQIALWRTVAGCGLGAVVPITIAIVADIAPAARRVTIVTLMASGFTIGAASSGLIAPWLSARWGWQGLFGYGGIMPLVIAVLCWWGIPDSRAAATGARGSEPNPAARVAALFTPQYRWRTLFMWLLTAMNLFANYGLFSWLPTLLVQNGWALADASRVTSFLAIGGLTGCYFVSTQADRGRTVMALMGVYLTGALALALLATNPGAAWMWALLIVFIGFGGIGASLTLAPLASTYYPPELRSTGVGWANGVGRAGSFFGPLALAWLMQKNLSPELVLGALMIPMALCALFVTLLPLALRAGARHQSATK
ncbi:MAG: MFS transporter [Proteobacteria bacterium]|nr:MFS transporter [Pseudomonadota bacterium]